MKNTSWSKITRVLNLAGMEGFEPPNGGTRTRCLTTWRHPNTLQLYQKKSHLSRVFQKLFIDNTYYF